MPFAVALAGRRVDAPGAEPPRFPLDNVTLVTERVRLLLAKLAPVKLVCSAACGADLIALGVAEARAIDAEIILPFDVARFRETSVVDRPGDWGPCFDRAIARARTHGRLHILGPAARSNDEAYAAVSNRILKRALELGGVAPGVAAVALWEEGAPGGDGDLTWQFVRDAERAGVRTESILTFASRQ